MESTIKTRDCIVLSFYSCCIVYRDNIGSIKDESTVPFENRPYQDSYLNTVREGCDFPVKTEHQRTIFSS